MHKNFILFGIFIENFWFRFCLLSLGVVASSLHIKWQFNHCENLSRMHHFVFVAFLITSESDPNSKHKWHQRWVPVIPQRFTIWQHMRTSENLEETVKVWIWFFFFFRTSLNMNLKCVNYTTLQKKCIPNQFLWIYYRMHKLH